MPQTLSASGLNKPYYLPQYPWPRRRFATTVLAGRFEQSSVADFWKAPPLEERQQNIQDAVVAHQSIQTSMISHGPASEPSTSEGPPASRREAVARGTTATSGPRAPEASTPKPPTSRRSFWDHMPPSKDDAPKNTQPRTSSSVRALNAPKNKSNLHKVYSPTPTPVPVTTAHTPTVTKSGKRPAATDSGGDARPAKKHRQSRPMKSSESTTSAADTADELSSPIYPTISIPLPSLTKEGTTIDSSSPSPKTLRPGASMSLSPAPTDASSVHHDVGGGVGGSAAPTRTKVKKGWKGWIEVESDAVPESPLLIKIDEPIVLPKTRQTRSGRRFADVNGDSVWEDDMGRSATPSSI